MDDTNIPPKNANGIAGKPLYPTLDANGNTFETLQAANAQAEPAPKFDIQESIKELHNKNPLQHIRTLQSDIANAVKANEASVLKVKIAEEKRNDELGRHGEDPRINIYLFYVSALLILASIGALSFALYAFLNKPQKAPPVKIDEKQIIVAENTKEIKVTSTDNTLQILQQELPLLQGAEGSLTRLSFYEETTTQQGKNTVITKKDLDAQMFATQMNTHMEPFLIRALKPEYAVGFHNNASVWNPFFIFKVDSYENAYPGMLTWEETMKADFAQMLTDISNQKPTSIQIATTTATSTTKATTTKSKSTKTTPKPAPAPVLVDPVKFEDGVIRNKDVRVLKNAQGKAILMYSFVDNNTLVITTDEETLKELIARLVTSQFVR